jgi:hypothetical protein
MKISPLQDSPKIDLTHLLHTSLQGPRRDQDHRSNLAPTDTLQVKARLMGYVYLAAIKVSGYLGAAYLLKRIYHNDKHLHIWMVTLTRLLLGLTVGLAYGALWILATRHREVGSNLTLYLCLLFPIRVGEWLVVFWLFFDKLLTRHIKAYLLASAGAFWSYALDGLAIMATALIPDRIWIA